MKRTVLAVAVAAVLALVGCSLLWLYVQGSDARVLAGKATVKVLVATVRIPTGTTGAEIRTGNLAEAVPMPRSAVPKDVLQSIDQGIEDLAVTSDIQPRQLLLRGAFAAATSSTGGLTIPANQIAVTVPLLTSAGTAFLQPGAKIAIFDTFTVREGTSPMTPSGDRLAWDHSYNQATRLLLPSVEVIAVGVAGQAPTTGQSAESAAQKATSALGGTSGAAGQSGTDSVVLVTVAVTQDEAQRLVHGTQTGTLYFALLGQSAPLQPGPGIDSNSLFN